LAGTYPGPTVVGLTGTANVVAMHGTTINSDAGVALTVTGANYTVSNGTAPTFTLRAPNATGTGTTNGGSWIVRSGTGTVSGSISLIRGSGNASFFAADNAGSEFVQVRGGANLYLDADTLVVRNNAGSAARATWTAAGIAFDAALSSVSIIQDSAAGAGAVMSIFARTSTNNVGGNLILGGGSGGGGNLPGSVHIVTGISTPAISIVASAPQPIVHFWGNSVRWSETSTPVLFQEQRSSDLACHDLTIQSQAPFSSASTNRLPGNIVMNVPPPSDGTDPHGNIQLKISNTEKLKLDSGILSSHVGVQFMDDFVSGLHPTFYAERAAADQDGIAMSWVGQQGGPGLETDGGDVFIYGGSPAGSGRGGSAGLFVANGACSVRAVSKDASSHFVTLATTAGFTTADLPENLTNAVFVGNSAGSPTTIPSNGFVIMGVNGRPLFYTSDGNAFMIDGTISGTAGAIVEYMQVQCGVNTRKIAIHAVS
jgi:hypothetical protein